MATPYEAPSLRRLRDACDRRWPKRDRRTDGWIADGNHSTTSDHYPRASGVVRARDLDRDGIHVPTVVAACLVHPSTAYTIHNRRIFSRRDGFRPRVYTGKNPHTGHIHESILHTLAAERSTVVWRFIERHPSWPTLRPGAKGEAVRQLQAYLNAQGASLVLDSDFGDRTTAAVRAFQRRTRITVDGIVGPVTKKKLRTA